MIVDRTLFWFFNESDSLQPMTQKYFGLANLLNILLNKYYSGKRIKFINLNYRTQQIYDRFPNAKVDSAHFYNGVLTFNGLFNEEEFDKFENTEKKIFLWDKACKSIEIASEKVNNNNLLDVMELVYAEGLKDGLNTNYENLKTPFSYQGNTYEASIFFEIDEYYMKSIFMVSNEGKKLFEKPIDRTLPGVEFFLEMYKKIEIDFEAIIIRGSKDIEYLPLRISFDEIFPS